MKRHYWWIVAGLAAYSGFLVWASGEDGLGELGDSTAMLGTVFSGLALLLLVREMSEARQQHEELLREQQQELAAHRAELEIQRQAVAGQQAEMEKTRLLANAPVLVFRSFMPHAADGTCGLQIENLSDTPAVECRATLAASARPVREIPHIPGKKYGDFDWEPLDRAAIEPPRGCWGTDPEGGIRAPWNHALNSSPISTPTQV